ncbi:hypothetical protein J6590_070837 [Homalodisca vitripennis]|nr:hypothetical protein J6590_070837 [Homalodisca vitripennis]
MEARRRSETEDWLSGIISHEHGFTWKGGLDSVTRGIWIWPKIYRRKTNNGTEVGILLVDNEGMFDGEATDGEIIALCGISTAMSYIQMFNVKDKITTDYLETVEGEADHPSRLYSCYLTLSELWQIVKVPPSPLMNRDEVIYLGTFLYDQLRGCVMYENL